MGTDPGVRTGIRYGMSLTAVLLGAWILINGTYPQFVSLVISHQLDPLLAAQLLLSLLFGVLVVVSGLVVAPGPLGRRIVGAAVFAAPTALYAALLPVLYSVGFGPAGPVLQAFALAPFMIALGATAGWLTVRSRPAIAYLPLVALVLIPIIDYGIVRMGSPTGLVNIVMNVLATVLGVGIAWAGRAIAGARSQPIG